MNLPRLAVLGRELLIALGEDPTHARLQDTPTRWARMWREFIEFDPGTTGTMFQAADHTDQMVVVSGMRLWSFCEHHLLPFWCDVSIGYIARGKVLGLSKFGRVAHQMAHRLQLQERLVHDIATEVISITGSKSVAVLAQGEHLCMTMRGIRTPSVMTSSFTGGLFRRDPRARAEFLAIATR